MSINDEYAMMIITFQNILQSLNYQHLRVNVHEKVWMSYMFIKIKLSLVDLRQEITRFSEEQSKFLKLQGF
jgi:hypothetical protein